ncbi:MAG: penicillin acylase family protein [Pseudomonadota bacterium]
MVKKVLAGGAFVCAAILIAGFYIVKSNQFKVNGTVELDGISGGRVVRDEKNMPSIYANSETDTLRIQGYVMAQDRLFQMHLTRLFASGRIAELAGDKGRASDIMMRTLGFRRQAIRHRELLNDDTLKALTAFTVGVNDYIRKAGTIPLEFRLSGIGVEPWAVEDTLTIMYYMGWGSAANVKTEILAQMLVEKIGMEQFRQILPINTNPDDPGSGKSGALSAPGMESSGPGSLAGDVDLDSMLAAVSDLNLNRFAFGSNCWCVGGPMSEGGMPVLADDPHLENGMLPGIFYPSCLVFPGMRAVGVTVPGIPGMIVGRNSHVAVGITNSYGDAQDLYVETIDPQHPDHYMEGTSSIPFETLTEVIKIRDKTAETGFRSQSVTVRLTRRGPVISGVLPKFATNRVVSLRWAPYETMEPDLGLFYLLRAQSVQDVRSMAGHVTFINLNMIAADIHGHMGWQTTGRLPIRTAGDGTVPFAVTGAGDNWSGFVPYYRMPADFEVAKGWIGNANHNTVPADYPDYVSSYFSPYYRYQRLKELISGPGKKSAEDHWRFQRDTVNVQARILAPVLSRALAGNTGTRDMGALLEQWNFSDAAGSVAPTLYHAIMERLAELVFQDELGEALSGSMLDTWYFWQERLEKMILAGASPWFDNVLTRDRTETLTDLIREAGLDVHSSLTRSLGKDMAGWTWGRVHTQAFVNPIRRQGFGTGIVGGRTYAMDGSGDTLLRARYPFGKPETVTTGAALRMVVDLSDEDKVLAVLPGGVTGRTFNSHFNDQLDSYMDGEIQYWWFSDRQIDAHKVSELVFQPPSGH